MIYVAENTIAMWAMQVALAACLLATSVAYFFESGYTHHYTYWAENSMFDQHNVSMILKVGTQYHRPCKVKLSCVYRWQINILESCAYVTVFIFLLFPLFLLLFIVTRLLYFLIIIFTTGITNVLPRFDWLMTDISQSTYTDEMHHTFEPHFRPTATKHLVFLCVTNWNWRGLIEKQWLYIPLKQTICYRRNNDKTCAASLQIPKARNTVLFAKSIYNDVSLATVFQSLQRAQPTKISCMFTL